MSPLDYLEVDGKPVYGPYAVKFWTIDFRLVLQRSSWSLGSMLSLVDSDESVYSGFVPYKVRESHHEKQLTDPDLRTQRMLVISATTKKVQKARHLVKHEAPLVSLSERRAVAEGTPCISLRTERYNGVM